MARYVLVVTAAFVASLSMATAPGPSLAEEAKVTHPLVIICEFRGVTYFGYLDRIDAEGVATYMTPSGLFATFSADGVFTRTGSDVKDNCAGKTLEELRTAGQTLSIKE